LNDGGVEQVVRRLREILAGLLLVAIAGAPPALSQGRSAEDRYIAVRDAAIEKIRLAEDAKQDPEIVAQEVDRAVADLTQRMRTLIGPVEIKTFPQPPKLHADTLYMTDVGFGMLDGLLFFTANEEPQFIVTTDTLFTRWLRTRKDGGVPQDRTAALKNTTFYTHAMSADAVVIKYLEMPIAKASTAKLAIALLVARTQDDTPMVPAEIFVAAIHGSKVFIAVERIEAKFSPSPACSAARAETVRKADDMIDAFRSGGEKDAALSEKAAALREQSEAHYLRCTSGDLKKQAAFALAVKQAQALYGRLPGR
jgi:hypothetical protein